MRYVTRNPYARLTIRAERVDVSSANVQTGRPVCRECGNTRSTPAGRQWLYQFYVDDDAGARHSGPIAGLYCSRSCAESYRGLPF